MNSLAETGSRMTNSFATPQFDLTPPSEVQLRILINGLSDEERRVMLHHGDEEPFCGVLLAEKREGVFTCRLCGLPLFRAGTAARCARQEGIDGLRWFESCPIAVVRVEAPATHPRASRWRE